MSGQLRIVTMSAAVLLAGGVSGANAQSYGRTWVTTV